jgi:hypothetical protein
VLALDGPGCKPFRTRIPSCSIAASPTPQQTFHREHDESNPRRTSRAPARAAIVRTRVLAWAVDVEVDPMVGGVVRFVDSGFWRGA